VVRLAHVAGAGIAAAGAAAPGSAPAGDGHNGYPLLWTLAFDDLDARQREQALAEDVQRWEADRAAMAAPPHLAEDHDELRSRPAASCGPTASDCLGQVRADPQRFVDAHAGHQQLHARWTSWPMRTTSCRRSGPRATASWCRCRPMAW
jgi:hypothetical protein